MLEQTRENKKFTYTEVARNARAREHSESIQWLVDAGLVVKVSQRVIVKGSTLFGEFNGAFVENYSAQELEGTGSFLNILFSLHLREEVEVCGAIFTTSGRGGLRCFPNRCQ